ncbi:MAG: hypothetical protein HYR63_14595 [Proteobacteria bacterium]|nr:hypothetical protein [Pseudomonadota bacterium]MBI3499545.1 hypothetical protein [Pseudomonadota bacterium]
MTGVSRASMGRRAIGRLVPTRLIVVVAILTAGISDARATAAALQTNGPAANRVNIVILGDGYRSIELSKFATDAGSLMGTFFSEDPWLSYRTYFNVWRIDRASNQSGGADSQSQTHDTAFGSYFNCFGIQRLLCADSQKVNTAVAQEMPAGVPMMVVVLVNDSRYGGSGGAFSVVSLDPNASQVMMHEVGHSFANLSDEYVDPSTCAAGIYGAPVNKFNVAPTSDRASLPWTAWVDAATPLPSPDSGPDVPGAYLGGYFCPQYFRPTHDSKMNHLGIPYYQVNQEQLLRSIYARINPIDSASPASSSVAVDGGSDATFSVSTLVPASGSALSIAWRLSGQLAGQNATLTLSAAALAALPTGGSVLEVAVSDRTSMVIRDPNSIMTRRRSWTLVKGAASSRPQTGWWWNPTESGRGFSFEVSGNNIFMSSYLYAGDGTPLWFVAMSPQQSNLTFQGPLQQYANGQTLSGSYGVPVLSGSVGSVTLSFASPTVGQLTWPGGTTPIQRFDFVPGGAAAGPAAGMPQTGWWWNPGEAGRGFFFEVQDTTMFLSGYMYDSSGQAAWYISQATMSSPTLYEGTLQEYRGGQTLGGAYKASSLYADRGTISIQFSTPTTAILTLPNGTQTPLQRFGF